LQKEVSFASCQSRISECGCTLIKVTECCATLLQTF